MAQKCVLQDWVMGLPGLRHQGVLLTAVRGCDTAPKDDASKLFTRCLRGVILNAFVGDARKAATFIEAVLPHEEEARFLRFHKNLDHYPHHYIVHLMHAVEIIGCHHPDGNTRERWNGYYLALCRGLHANPETKEQLDERLTLDELAFAARDRE